MRNLNQYQFNEWRPHVYEETAQHGHQGMIDDFAKQGRFGEALDSITTEKTGTWAWEWVNPARRGVIRQKRQSSGYPSRRQAWENAMNWMLDATRGNVKDLSSHGAEETLSDKDMKKWEDFHKSQGHEIKYEE